MSMDWESEFSRIVERVDTTDMPDPDVGISQYDISMAISKLTETAMLLSDILAASLLDVDTLDIPSDVVNLILGMANSSDSLCDKLITIHQEMCEDCDCEECLGDEDRWDQE